MSKASIDAGKAVITVGLDTKGIDKGIQQTQAKMRMLSKGIGDVGRSMVGLGAAITGGVGGALASLAIPLKLAAQIENVTTSFQVLTGSLQTTTKLLGELKTLSARTPMQFDDITAAAQKLIQFGVSADNVTETIRRLGDASGGDAASFATLADVFGKVASGGRLLGQEANRLIDAGFNPLTVIAKETGEQMGDLRKRMSQGGVSFKEFESALVRATSAGGQFFGLLEKQSRTLTGSFSTLKDAIGLAIVPIGQALAPAVKTLVQNLIVVSQRVQEFFERNQELVRTVAKATIVVGALGIGLVAAGSALLITNAALNAGVRVLGLFGRATGTLSSAFRTSFGQYPNVVRASMASAQRALSSGFDSMIGTAATKNAALAAAMVPAAGAAAGGVGGAVGAGAAGVGSALGSSAVKSGAAIAAGIGGAELIKSAFGAADSAMQNNMDRLLETQSKGWGKLVKDSQTQVGKLQATIAGLAMSDAAKREISEIVGVPFSGEPGRSKRLTGRASERMFMAGDQVNFNSVFAEDPSDRARASRASQSAFNRRAAMEANQMAGVPGETKRLGKSSMPKSERKRLAAAAAGRKPATIARPKTGLSGVMATIGKTPKAQLGFMAAAKAGDGLMVVLRGLATTALKLATPFAGLLVGAKMLGALLMGAAGAAAGFATGILLPLAGVVAIGGGLVYVAKQTGVWQATIASITGTMKEFGKWAGKLFTGIKDAVSAGDIGGLFKYAFAEAKFAAVALIEYLVDKTPKILNGVFIMLGAAFDGLLTIIKKLPGAVINSLFGVGTSVGTLIGDSMSKGFDGALKDLKKSLRDDADTAFDNIKRKPAAKAEDAAADAPPAPPAAPSAAPEASEVDNTIARNRRELITAFGDDARDQIQNLMVDIASVGRSEAQRNLVARRAEISRTMQEAGKELQQALAVASTVEDTSRALAEFRGHTLAANEALQLANRAAQLEGVKAFADELKAVKDEALSLVLDEAALRRKELAEAGVNPEGIRILELADSHLKIIKDLNDRQAERKRVNDEKKSRADSLIDDLKTPLERMIEAQQEIADLQKRGLLTQEEATRLFEKNLNEINDSSSSRPTGSGFRAIKPGSGEHAELVRNTLAHTQRAMAETQARARAGQMAAANARNAVNVQAAQNNQNMLEMKFRRDQLTALGGIERAIRSPRVVGFP